MAHVGVLDELPPYEQSRQRNANMLWVMTPYMVDQPSALNAHNADYTNLENRSRALPAHTKQQQPARSGAGMNNATSKHQLQRVVRRNCTDLAAPATSSVQLSLQERSEPLKGPVR